MALDKAISGWPAGDGDGGEFIIAKGGTNYKVTGNAPQGPVIYDAQGNIISRGQVRAYQDEATPGAVLGSRSTNIFHEPNGEFDRLYWNITSGNVSTSAHPKYGGLHYYTDDAFEAWTAGRVYDAVNFRDYFILFEDMGLARLDYKVELLAYDGVTSKAILVDWTPAQQGLNIVDLKNSNWPTTYSAQEWQTIRLWLRGTTTGPTTGLYRFAAVSLSQGEPYYPPRDDAQQKFYMYRHGAWMNGAGYQGDVTGVAAGTVAWIHRNTFTLPGGWRLRVGMARYFAWDSAWRLYLYANDGTAYSWTSSVNRYNGAINLTLVPTVPSTREVQVNIGFKNISGSTATLYKDDGAIVYVQPVPL